MCYLLINNQQSCLRRRDNTYYHRQNILAKSRNVVCVTAKYPPVFMSQSQIKMSEIKRKVET